MEVRVTVVISKSFIIFDCCLVFLVKFRTILKLEDMSKFFKSWHRADKYRNKIYYCLKMNWPILDFDTMLQLLLKIEHKFVIQIV